MTDLRSVARSCVRTIFRLLPSGFPEFAYQTLLAPRPLRTLANAALVAIMPKEIAIPEGTLFLNTADPPTSGALALDVYERYESELIRGRLKPGMTVIDIGANLGYYTLIAARHVGAGRVIAFEPEPENFSLLSKMIEHNALGNVVAQRTALAERPGELPFHLFKSNKGRHSLIPVAKHSENAGTILVPAERGDDALASLNIARADIIKIDVEGAEVLVLRGMPRLLAAPGTTLFIEFSPESIRRSGATPVDLLELLASYGFSLFEICTEERTLKEIGDFVAFAARFKGEEHADLLCTKDQRARTA